MCLKPYFSAAPNEVGAQKMQYVVKQKAAMVILDSPYYEELQPKPRYLSWSAVLRARAI